MKVVISGASGFLGSWISRVLSSGHEVVALVRDSSDLYKLSQIEKLEIVQLELSAWYEFLEKSKCEVLILNDWSGVGNQYRNDEKQLENVLRISRLTHSARAAGVKTVIGVGSQAELGPIDSSISEFSSDNPTTMYGKAKVETRILLEGLLKNSDVRFVWMRIFSTYGPLDEGSWLIPNIVDSLVNEKEVKLTKGEQDWSYLHAYDLACALKTLVTNSLISGIVNVGNPQTISIYDAASTIGKILEKEKLLKFGALDYRPDQVMRLQPLCETLTKAGWRPQISFEQGIRQTIDWLQRKDLQPIITESGQALDFKLPVRP